MSTPTRTPSAALLIRTFQSEAANWDDVTTTDAPLMMREKAASRRDAIDWAIAQLRTALPAIEDEAAEGERGVAEWLDAGAGIPPLFGERVA